MSRGIEILTQAKALAKPVAPGDSMSNPYEAPQTHGSEKLSDVAGRSRFATYFTQITVNGCNLLGLLTIFAVIGALVFGNRFHEQDRPALAGLLGLVVAGICLAIDAGCRLNYSGRSGWARLLSPNAGGCLLFLPVWPLYLVLTAFLVVATVYAAFRS